MTDIGYRQLTGNLGIAPGSLLMVTADLTRLAMQARRKEGEFDINAFIDSIQQFLTPDGTLVIPSFNFNLKNNDHYSPERSVPITGALAVEALKRTDFLRTKHPLHSFLVWGKYAETLAELDNSSSFGEDSPFAFFKANDALMLLIDTSITDAFTFVHHVEEMEQVNYRRYREIKIIFDNDMENRGSYLLYAKKPGWTMALEGLENLLKEKNIATSVNINKIPFTLVKLTDSYDVIRRDIRDNKAANLARYDFKLYLRETAKSILGAAGIHTLADKISHDPGLL